MKAHLLTLNPAANVKNQWDFGLLKSIFDDLAITYEECQHLQHEEEAIVVLPARHHVGMEKAINRELSRIGKVVLFLVGDEEAVFRVERISHPNIKIWVQNPRPGRHDAYSRIGTGFPQHMAEKRPSIMPQKRLDFFFAGQSLFNFPEGNPPMNVNVRRKAMADQLESLDTGEVWASKGFTQGLPHEEYYQKLSSAKVAPCPSGPELPDTFRMYEALELGCVPIADEITRKEDFPGYWTWFFGEEPPFPVIRDYNNLPGWIEDCVAQYPTLNNRCQAWWYRKKWAIKESIGHNWLTVIIPVSPIPSNPDTSIIDETIASIRHHLPQVKIVVTFDGVREEQKDMKPAYEEYIRAVLWKHRDIYPIIFETHQHQIGMMRALFEKEEIKTSLLMYVEQDTPLEKDFIDFDAITDMIASGRSNLVRLHHESEIPEPHKYLMLGSEFGGSLNVEFVKTAQWSQRPHIASTAYYRRIVKDYFSPTANCMIEDRMHGIVINAFNADGEAGWQQHRLHIYHPEGSIRRSYHTDGRQGSKKFDEEQVW